MTAAGAPSAATTSPEASPPTAVRFLKGLLTRALLLLAGTATLNFVVNPAGAYPTRLFEPIVVSSRRPKMLLYARHRPVPRIVILGSSRTFAADPGYVERRTGRPTFNASVHAAGTPDYLDIVECIEATGGPFPDTVFVGLGVEQMIEHLPARAERSDPLAECRGGAPRPIARLSAYRGLLEAGELAASVRLLGLEVRGRPAPAYTFGPDGELRAAVPSGPLEDAVAAGLAGNWKPATFLAEGLNEASLADLLKLLEQCRDRHARVVVFLPPYHPRAVARYEAESRFDALRRQLVERLGSLASRFPLRSYDFTKIDSFGGREDMFYDASHPTAEAFHRMFDVMLADGS